MSFHPVSMMQAGYRFTRHYLGAGNEHDVHSPFVFKLLTNAVYKKQNENVFDKIESIRKQYLADTSRISVLDLGAGSSFDGRKTERSIREIARRFAKSPRYCRVLYNLVKFQEPVTLVELGTSLGISSMYLASGHLAGMLYSIEGCPETAQKAASAFRENGFQNIRGITGAFDMQLPLLLDQIKQFDFAYIDGNHTYEATLRYFDLLKSHSGKKSVIVFDDIYWSEGMQQAWNEIKKNNAVTLTIDFFRFGVVYFDDAFTKQDFRLRL